VRRVAALLLGLGAGLLLGEGLVRLAAGLRPGGRSGYSAPISAHDPLLGWRLLPGAVAHHVTPEFEVEVAIDAFGLRQNPAPGAGEPGRPRVVVVGDSFVFGQGVPEDARFTERLATRLDAQVINLGVPGTGTDQQCLLFEEDGPQRGADLVLLAYFVDNVTRNAAPQRDGRPKPYFRLVAGELRLENVPVPQALPPATAAAAADSVRDERLFGGLRRALWAHSELYQLARRELLPRLAVAPRGAGDDPYPQYAEGEAAWEVTQALFARLRDAARAEGAVFALAFVPEAWQLAPDAPAGSRRAVAAACERLGVPLLDLTEALAEASGAGAPLYYPQDGHWTAAGHAAAAAALEPFVRDLLAAR